jgi:hypothetical protein
MASLILLTRSSLSGSAFAVLTKRILRKFELRMHDRYEDEHSLVARRQFLSNSQAVVNPRDLFYDCIESASESGTRISAPLEPTLRNQSEHLAG